MRVFCETTPEHCIVFLMRKVSTPEEKRTKLTMITTRRKIRHKQWDWLAFFSQFDDFVFLPEVILFVCLFLVKEMIADIHNANKYPATLQYFWCLTISLNNPKDGV